MPRPSPSGRFGHTNPLRRLFGLQLLAERLPEAMATTLIRAWMFPARYDGNQAIQSLERQRLPEDALPWLPPRRLDLATQIELLVARRMVEIPRTEIQREVRNRLLREQGAYLAHIYQALVSQRGEAAAQAAFTRCLLAA